MNQFKHINRDSSDVRNLMEIWQYLNVDPPYQREGNIWSISQKRLFIDSLINGFDVPKLYFRRVNETQQVDDQQRYIRFEVVDGKQRLETVHDFLNNSFDLGRDVKIFNNEDIDIRGLTADRFKEKYPDVFFDLVRYQFDIVLLDGMSEEIVDEFFIRLNEGTSLNAQEKRNAITCALSKKVTEVTAGNSFVQTKLRQKARYKNREIVAKFFSLLDQEDRLNKISDTKKNTLDRLYIRSRNGELSDDKVNEICNGVETVLTQLSSIFSDQDPLLYSLGNIVVFFYSALKEPELWEQNDTIKLIRTFENSRRQEFKDVDPQTLSGESQKKYFLFDEYNQYVQSTNDGTAIEFRSHMINSWIRTQGNISEFIKLESSEVEKTDLDPSLLDLE